MRILALSALAALAGCSEPGPTSHRLSGEALLNGQPIPYGDVLFSPNGAKGNAGPQGFANIRDGKFDTKGEDGKGIGGGATVIRVTGLTGPNGKVICVYEYEADLPSADGTLKIDVPAKAAADSKKPEI